MLAVNLIAEGLGLGLLLCLVCAIGIWNGAGDMVHLYDPKVQERAVQLGLTSRETIKNAACFSERCVCRGTQTKWAKSI